MDAMNRRDALKILAVGGGAAALASTGCAARGASSREADRHAAIKEGADFSFVHITDMHVRRKRRGDAGYRAAVASVNALDPRPAFVLAGGDLAFDGNYTAKDEFEDQIALYKEISAGYRMPHWNCLGNHDALGWSSRRKCDPNDPEIGMKMIMDRLGMERNYYSFDAHGWHFAILDTMLPKMAESGPTYESRIGDEQLAWLAKDLGRAGKKPKVVVMHIAAFCASGQIDGNADAKAMNPGAVVLDNRALRLVLERHGVKAVLQGHSHLVEDYALNGVNYITSTAASACWWSGTWNGFPYGYTQLFAKDGELSWERKTYAWDTHLEPEDTLERRKTEERAAFEAEQARLLAEERA